MSTSSLEILIYLRVLRTFWFPLDCLSFFGIGLFKNMFHDLLIYIKIICFGYITLSYFFETFLSGSRGRLCVGGWKIRFQWKPSHQPGLGYQPRVCQKLKNTPTTASTNPNKLIKAKNEFKIRTDHRRLVTN